MDPEPHAEVVVGRASDVEGIGVVERGVVAVPGGEQEDGEIAGPQDGVLELDVLAHVAAGQLDGGDVAHHLLDGGPGRRGVLAPYGHLVGVFEQGQRTTGDEVDGRAVPGGQQQDAGRQQLRFAQDGPHRPRRPPGG